MKKIVSLVIMISLGLICMHPVSASNVESNLVQNCPTVSKKLIELFKGESNNTFIFNSYGEDVTDNFIKNNMKMYKDKDIDQLLLIFSKNKNILYVDNQEYNLSISLRKSNVITKDYGQYYTLLTSKGGTLTHGELGYYIRLSATYNEDTGRFISYRVPSLVNYGGTYFTSSGWSISSSNSYGTNQRSVIYNNIYVSFWGARTVGGLNTKIYFDPFTPNPNDFVLKP